MIVKVPVRAGIYVCWRKGGLPALPTRFFSKDSAEEVRKKLIRPELYAVREIGGRR